MAFRALVSHLRHNADHKPGGGEHTMFCLSCKEPLNNGDLINGPTRNRQNVVDWTCYNVDTYSGVDKNPGHAHKLQYWHANCAYPQGNNGTPVTFNPSTPSQSQPVTQNQDNDAILQAVTNLAQNNKIALEGMANSILGIKQDTQTLGTHVNELNKHVPDLLNRIAVLESNQPTTFNISTPNTQVSTTLIGRQHKSFNQLVKVIVALEPEDRNIWLTGPAGSGKTTAARKLAETLQLPFYFNGAIDNEYKLSGFINAQGQFMSTAFYNAWVNGGVYLFDEVDASMPGALLAFNAALANGYAAFPNEPEAIKRNINCYILAAANTWGEGASSQYVGRAKLDGATLDRFATLEWGYDTELELSIVRSNFSSTRADAYVAAVQATRKLVFDAGASMIVSPRASYKGAQLLRDDNFTKQEVISTIFARHQSHEMWATIGKPIIDWAKDAPSYTTNHVSPTPTSNNNETTIKHDSYGNLDAYRSMLATLSVYKNAPWLQEMKSELRAGNRINAIQKLRVNHPYAPGLKECKDMVESIPSNSIVWS